MIGTVHVKHSVGWIHYREYIHMCHRALIYCTDSLQWRHNERDGSLINGISIVNSTVFFGRRSKKTSKLRVAGLCQGNSPVNGEFPAQRASNAENVSIWWRHHGMGTIALMLIFRWVLPFIFQQIIGHSSVAVVEIYNLFGDFNFCISRMPC